MVRRIAVIGAGIAGLTAATRLAAAGHSVLVLDKGRGVGGRTSTRRADGLAFDHGAQYFTARDPGFRRFLDDRVPPDRRPAWEGRFATLKGGQLGPESSSGPRLVGVPGMNAIAQCFAAGLETRTGTKVNALAGSPGEWSIRDDQGASLGPFDWVVVTAPPAQASGLLAGHSPISDEAAGVAMLPCFTLMIAPTDGATLPADGIRCEHPVLGWAAIEGSKPGRAGSPSIVIQSSNEWAAAHVDDDLASVARALKDAASEAFGVRFGAVSHESVHRWLYAKPARPLGRPSLIDPEARLAACGDWCLAGKVEGAYLSGDACASALLAESA